MRIDMQPLEHLLTLGNIHFFTLTEFGITNVICYLHVCHWLRKLVSGVSDTEFYNSINNKQVLQRFPVWQQYRIRSAGRLFRCCSCMGFYIGSLLAYFYSYPNPLLWGLASSGFNFIVWALIAEKAKKL